MSISETTTTCTARGTPDLAGLRAEIRSVLATAPVAQARARRDPRPVHRLLGERGLLAPQWPRQYGGRGTTHVEAAVLIEEMARHDVPDLLHTLTVQIVGSVLLTCASEELKTRYLPALASGETAACVLFSEPQAGSDLSALSTTAIPEADGSFRLHGTKTYSMFAPLADIALCLARTGDGTELTLFLVRLDRPGVSIRPFPTIGEDAFHEITLDGIRVDADAVVGEIGGGWAMLVSTLVFERTGIDYLSRALRWHEEATTRLRAVGSELDLRGANRLAVHLDAATVLVSRVLTRLENGVLGEAEAAVAKWYTTELAARVAWWSAERQGDRSMLPTADGLVDPLDVALRESPGLRISGGTSEMLLETVARLRLDSEAEVLP